VALREKIEDCEKHLNLHKVIEALESFYIIITPKYLALSLWTVIPQFYPLISQKEMIL
jgi:hypothetical protein